MPKTSSYDIQSKKQKRNQGELATPDQDAMDLQVMPLSRRNLDPENPDRLPENLPPLDHADLPPQTRLTQLNMLGSHDAGTYLFSKEKAQGGFALGKTFPGPFKCQSLDLVGQAEAGIRYFDLRVERDKSNIYRFFHNFSSTGGDALEEVKKLLRYAAGDERNLYIMKLHFKKRDARHFIRQLSDFEQRIIQNNASGSEKPLGSLTIDNTIGQNRNILLLVKNAEGSIMEGSLKKYFWDYDKNTNTKWADQASGSGTGSHILNFHGDRRGDRENKFNIIQTNMPMRANPISKDFNYFLGLMKLFSVKNLAADQKEQVANFVRHLVLRGVSPGIISMDYAGKDDRSDTRLYRQLVDDENRKLTNANNA
ncbi:MULTISPECIES: hypothetical protein [Burkholderiaceae]|uniref:hypothetical protein n=1 Tax=Burkholderiaceae TaxID=119060 RepID=UPI00096851E3|nr:MULTISPECIES: hypothetical protein [Burkholderiaceae]MCG1040491.1 hypothetical protein [Mycetohabitans sp. B7]SIT75443.1 hypothetical protein SAMN04487769_2514 [Burkholderia sp. b14]